MTTNLGVGVPDDISRLSLGEETGNAIPEPPDMSSQGVIAVDITDKFSRASKALEPGEIVKDAFFTLFESVGALEIGDPKMDSGCVKPGDEFEELYDVSRTLLPEEVLGIIDQLLCFEMSWHLGYPLSQTVFTSVYVEALLMPNPHGIDQARFVRRQNDNSAQQPMLEVLRAYCLGMLKACGYVNERVRAEHSYEEEDFVTNTYNRMLLDTVSTDSIRHVIAEALALLQNQKGSMSDEILDALTNRLKLRDIFLSAVQCPEHVDHPDIAKQPWIAGIDILPSIKASHPLGKPVEEAFSAKLQRKLASTVPPRPIVKLEFDDAFGHLTRLFQDGRDVISVLKFTNSQCLLKNFVLFFQAKKPQPLVYIRTLLQTFLFDAMEMLGNMSIRQILDDDFSIITLPASPFLDRANDEIEAPHDPRHFIAQQMELFRQRAAQPYLDILRTFCQNRCRVRRTLCHAIRAWDTLQGDAEELDQQLQIKSRELLARGDSFSSTTSSDTNAWPLSAWTYMYKLRQMEWIVQLGFELEVYQVDEFAGMYWYLNYLSKLRLEYAPRIKTFIAQKAAELRSHPISDLAAERQLQRSLSFMRLSLLDAAVTWELSDALSCIYTVLARLDLLKPPKRPYSNDELRYELRMKPFAQIGIPELPSFEDFTAQVTQRESSTEDILAVASSALVGVKKGFESLSRFSAEESFSVESHDRWVASVKGALKSCISMGLVVTTLQKAVQRVQDGGELKLKVEIPTPDKAYHEWWIVPKLIPTQ